MYLNFIFKAIQSSGEQESWIVGGKGQKKGCMVVKHRSGVRQIS